MALNARVRLFVGAGLELESEFLRKAGKLVDLPTCVGRNTEIVVYIIQREKMSERPGNKIALSLIDTARYGAYPPFAAKQIFTGEKAGIIGCILFLLCTISGSIYIISYIINYSR